MAKNEKVEKILDEIGERNSADHLLKLNSEEETIEKTSSKKTTKETPTKKHAKKQTEKHPETPIKEQTKEQIEKPKAKPVHQIKDKLNHGFMDDGFTLKIKPKIIIKWVVLLLIFVSVFYLGRLTAAPGTTILEETPIIKEETSFITSLSGFFTSIIPDLGSEEVEMTTEDSPTEETTVEETTEEAAEVEPEPETTTEAGEDEDVVTTYSKVELEFQDITADWKNTWGKITKVKYKITNGELGTIKPDHFIMIVDGYTEDFEQKTIPLPISSQTIRSGTAVSTLANVPSGFAYSPIEVGDINNAIITLQLYDVSGNLIDAKSKPFDLES
ncbi:MAG: hypothetical protein KKH52_04140 [Nanoarchaeota archaeon]|nr:hypothetical protein [Nanoarchaeota archaeon]MBU1623312.1 hypothetical protein [Nanoarchaeota archaeon]MBU1974560.1 hypothetical protein [Nanoarchaeota archaeon]